MSDAKVSTDFSHCEEGHDGKVDPDLVAMMIGHLNVDVAMNRDKLQLSIRHDPIGIEGLAWLVQPDGLVWPPESKI